jgi:hypothetical protein
MKTSSQRMLTRIVHIVSGTMIGLYFYSPLGLDSSFQAAVKFIVIPLFAVSGLWMWKSEAIRKWIKHG